MWGEIKGFPNYEVSTQGIVRNKVTGRIVKPSKTRNGYLKVNLYVNGKSSSKLLHRLVAETFIPNTWDKPTVDHIDGDKENNYVENLRWATQYEQCYNREMSVSCCFYAIHLRTHKKTLYTSQRECAKELNINQASISLCLSGKKTSAKGYTFRKVDEGHESSAEINKRVNGRA